MRTFLIASLTLACLTGCIPSSSGDGQSQPDTGDRPNANPAPLPVAEKPLYQAPLISTDDLRKRLTAKEKLVVADVRSTRAFDQEHIAGSVSLPWAELGSRHQTFSKDDTIVLYCACPDEHSALGAATDLHTKYSFNNLLVLKGGIREWREKGYELTRGQEALAKEMALDGPRLYTQHCAGCHGGRGEGMGVHYPPLDKNAMMRARDPWAATYVVLKGFGNRPLNGKHYTGTMGGFDRILTDAEIASLLTYARDDFGGVLTPVMPEQVAKVRKESKAQAPKLATKSQVK